MTDRLLILYKFVFMIIFASNVAHAGNLKWNLNDVSYLFPLPQKETDTVRKLLHPLDKGKNGHLLPETVQKRLPTLLNAGNGNDTLFKDAIRLVAIRLDPCPDEGLAGLCKPEMRLVWQPVEFDRFQKKWMSRDAAVHSFYKLSTLDFESLKSKLLTLKKENESKLVSTHNRPLNIHPALLNPMTEPYFRANLSEIILSYCGEANLKKVTFMSLLVPTRWWRFGSFVQDDLGDWVAEEIPRLNTTSEDLFNVALEPSGSSKGPGVAMDAIFNILPENYPAEDDITGIINRGYRFNDDNDLPIFESKLHAIERFKNPNKTTAANLDCASCHYAGPARFYAESRFPQLSQFASSDAFPNPNPSLFNLSNTTIAKEATRIVRAFGFFDDQPAINQRAINESANVAHWLNTH